MNDEKSTKLDRMIEAALTSQDSEILKETGELGYFALGLKQFSGKLGWVTWLITTLQILMFLIAIWCGINFFNAGDVLAAVKWGISGAVLALMALQMKLSLVPQMQADRVIREIKRLQLMIAAR